MWTVLELCGGDRGFLVFGFLSLPTHSCGETFPTAIRLEQNTVTWENSNGGKKREARRGLNFGMVDEKKSSWEFLYALAQVCSGVQVG